MAEIVVKKRKDDANHFCFCGVIVGKRGTTSTQTVTLRVSTNHNGRLYTNHPMLLAFDQKVQEKIDVLPLRVPVVAEGYITSRKPDKEPTREKSAEQRMPYDRPLQTFILTDIRLAEENEKENRNEVDITGSVEKAYVGKGNIVHFIIVSFREGHYMKRIKVDLFPKDDMNYQEVMSMMVAGTRLHVQGHCSTITQDMDRMSRHLEFIVADNVERA